MTTNSLNHEMICVDVTRYINFVAGCNEKLQ